METGSVRVSAGIDGGRGGACRQSKETESGIGPLAAGGDGVKEGVGRRRWGWGGSDRGRWCRGGCRPVEMGSGRGRLVVGEDRVGRGLPVTEGDRAGEGPAGGRKEMGPRTRLLLARGDGAGEGVGRWRWGRGGAYRWLKETGLGTGPLAVGGDTIREGVGRRRWGRGGGDQGEMGAEEGVGWRRRGRGGGGRRPT
uniref:Glycine-rich cell wall structural protein 1.8-like n=1 Tax=Elaeis guineensis var. tenera TaxID=51953 RepID=A0A6I9SFL5_ELAGV|nr:glycine-rich cell wall structural protein 1.8-like [Elaeis guineensis]